MTTAECTPTISPIARIEALYERLTKAKELVAKGKVSPLHGHPEYFIVQGKVLDIWSTAVATSPTPPTAPNC